MTTLYDYITVDGSLYKDLTDAQSKEYIDEYAEKLRPLTEQILKETKATIMISSKTGNIMTTGFTDGLAEKIRKYI